MSAAIIGAGAPPVVYLSGLWLDEPGDDYDVDPGSGWHQVLRLLDDPTTAMLYDRAGVGRSDPAPEGRRVGGALGAADELHQLLVALSIGGYTAEAFARVPQRDRGPGQRRRHTPRVLRTGDKDLLLIDGRGGRRFHMLDDDSATRRYPGPLRIPAVVLASNVERWPSPPPERNINNISPAERNARWQCWQRDAAARLGAAHIVVDAASHMIHRDAPALVAYAVAAVVRAVRERRSRAALDPRYLLETGGRLMAG